MNKVDRLNLVVARYGHEFVLPYRVCHSWPEIEMAVRDFESTGQKWGMRTDYPGALHQGMSLPFVKDCTLQKVRDVWVEYGSRLVYIIHHTIHEECINAVALRLDSEHVFFEYNVVDLMVSQRRMYDHPRNLRWMIVGPMHLRQYSYDGSYSSRLPVFVPEDSSVQDLRFSTIYRIMEAYPEESEITFTIRLNTRKIVIW